ncbi:hypothetical protein ACRRGR_003245 [Vibrio alginolyticus]
MKNVKNAVNASVKKSLSSKKLELKPVFSGNGGGQKVGGNCTGCGNNVAFGLKLAVGW